MKRAALAIVCLAALSGCTSKGPARIYEPVVVSAEEKQVAMLDASHRTHPGGTPEANEHDTQFSGD